MNDDRLPARKAAVFAITENHTVIVDKDLIPWLECFPWKMYRRQRCWYAKCTITTTTGRHTVSMHRLIARTPKNMVCHHRNRNSLDNRRANLLNMIKEEHTATHRDNTLLIQFKNQPEQPTKNPQPQL